MIFEDADIEFDDEVFPYRNLTLVYPEDQFENVRTEAYYVKTLFHDYKKHLVRSRFRFHKIVGADGYQIKVYSDSGKKKLLAAYTVGSDAHTLDTDVLSFKFGYNKLTAKVRSYKMIDGKKVYGQWSAYANYR